MKKKTLNIIKMFTGMLMSPVSIIVAISAGALAFGTLFAGASRLPSPESVMSSYMENPYIRFYRGSRGIAWTTVHPEGNALSSYGTYVYTDGNKYRAAEGTTVIPEGVVSRKEVQGGLKPGQHYYEDEITDSVVPVGKWVLSHREARCIHGPFSACRDYEYYGIDGLPNSKCESSYDSGWIAYCADCGKPLTGFVYTNDTCVGKIGYLFAGTGEFAEEFPVEYLFFCPVRGDNLENDRSLGSHMCDCFISCNRYTVRYNGNGALSGSMPDSVFYYGGSDLYEGEPVSGEAELRENRFFNPGYIFGGWSDSPDGEAILADGSDRESVEESFACLNESGDEADDAVVTLYAVWIRCDSAVLICGGNFRDEQGAYNGVVNGDRLEGYNLFEKGYMYETEIDPANLSHPKGYRIELNMMGGPDAGAFWTGTAFAGWTYTDLYGTTEDLMSDGKFTYIHSSETDSTVDIITAEWESIPATLPDAVYPGFVFDGWYTDPDMAPDHFAGREGDLFDTDHDMILYAKFKTLDLEASADYMGNESFGELRYDGLARLNVPGAAGYDLYKFFIREPGTDSEWTEALTEKTGAIPEPSERHFSVEGEPVVYSVSRTGIYTLELWGGAGASYGSYSGENGEYSSCEILLYEGDTVEIFTGRSGRTESVDGGVICGGGEGSRIDINGRTVMSCAGGKGADHVLNLNREFSFTGNVQTFTAEAEGDYELEVWGARGSAVSNGFNAAGNGGYASGTVHLNTGDTLYICVGGMNGYNGGGSGGRDAYGNRGGCGGGATHIAYDDGVLKNLSGARDRVLIVAGGGGGSAGDGSTSGSGGGLTGGGGRSLWPGGPRSSSGGSQTGAGSGWFRGSGGFGYGGNTYSYNGSTEDYPFIMNGGGGGGWYGGGGGDCDTGSYGCGGGGGSGYTGGVENGNMTSGACGGNGHASISCNINVTGRDAIGCGTSFSADGLLYRDHMICVHSECIYPDRDTEKAGYCIIMEPAVRFYGSCAELVYSPDKEAPDPVSSAGLYLDPDNGRIEVYWKMPRDNGSLYSYMARAYRSTDMISSADNYVQTDDKALRITTGVYGYFYLIDTYEHAGRDDVTGRGGFVYSPWAEVSGTAADACFDDWYENTSSEGLINRDISFVPDGNDKYIHIVSADRAGNTSDVFDLAIDGKNAYIPYPVRTEKLVMTEAENVYRAPDREDVFYVRADSATPFYIEHSSFIYGFARDGYQIDEALFHQSAGEYAAFVFPLSDISSEERSIVSTDCFRTSAFYPRPIAEASGERSDLGRRLCFTGGFITSYEGELFIYPEARAHLETGAYALNEDDRIIRSEPVMDRSNGLTIIGDATPPDCYVSVNGGGYERLSECNISNVLKEYVIDRRSGSVSVELCITDEGSGAKEGSEIRIYNLDNGSEGIFTVTGDRYPMELKMDEDSTEPSFENLLFNGEFIIYVYTEDNVGNKGVVTSAGIHELDISGSIRRCLDELTGPVTTSDGEAYIKRGESGYVVSNVWGYPDAVLVSFDNEKLSCYDTLYIINGRDPGLPAEAAANTVTIPAPEYMLEERTNFTVPLDYDGNVIKVTITAFRHGESLVWKSECALAGQGTVLDELITVLR